MTSLPPDMGRADHPWSAAAEQGCSALPNAGTVAQRETGDRMISRAHSQVPGLGHRVSGSGLQEQVQVPGLNPNLYQYPYLQPRPET